MTIRTYEADDLPGVIALWNGCVARGETLYRPLTAAYFHEKFLQGPHAERDLVLVAANENKVCGFAAGCRLRAFLPGQNNENTPGYLTMLLVEQALRRQGLGSALLAALEERLRARGKSACAVSSLNPVQLDWIVPGTPGHEHNNAPGADEAGMGYAFLLRHGYETRVREVAMYLDLADFRKRPEVEQKRAALAARGIAAGLYDPALGFEFDTLCDRVGSEYWRSVLQKETASPAPRPILAASAEGRLVGFTGPVDKQENGRGWFTGICTDPAYEKLGIATVLFSDLMEQFVRVGARYSTLFTGVENHAQRLYCKTGFRPVRHFAIMQKKWEA